MAAKDKYSYGYAKSLNNYFKNHEQKFDKRLKPNTYYVIRFDGKGMTKAFKQVGKAIYEPFFNTMKQTFVEFCETYSNIIFGYSFSDEISILLKGDINPKSKSDVDNNRIEKLLSLMSGKLALIFNRVSGLYGLDLQGKDWLFDARIIELKDQNEVTKYFISRQAFAIDKYLGQLRGEYGLPYTLNTSTEIIKALKRKRIDYYNLKSEYRYGLIYYNEIKEPFEFDQKRQKLNSYLFSSILPKSKVS